MHDDSENRVWNCRESRKAREQLDALAAHPSFEKLWVGVTWLIRRNPTAGWPVTGRKHTYVLKSEDFMNIGIPIILVTYSIIDHDQMVCEIISVERPAKRSTKASAPKAAAVRRGRA
jgi:hypothetical protein